MVLLNVSTITAVSHVSGNETLAAWIRKRGQMHGTLWRRLAIRGWNVPIVLAAVWARFLRSLRYEEGIEFPEDDRAAVIEVHFFRSPSVLDSLGRTVFF